MSSSFSPLVFTGVSNYSSDFQTILSRAVSIATIPLTRMQNDQSDLLAKKNLLSSLDAVVADLGQKVGTLGTLATTKSLAASSSDAAKVSVTATGATAAATYSITDVSSVAAAAAETTLAGYANSQSTPVSAKGAMQLVVGAKTYTLDLSKTNNLVGLRDAINQLGAGVTATILTTGTGDKPNYLSISASTTGATTLQLIDPNGTVSGGTSASVTGSAIDGGAVDTSALSVDMTVDGAAFTVDFTNDPNQGGAESLADIASYINSSARAALGLGEDVNVVSVADNRITLTSTTQGSASSVSVTGSAGALALGFGDGVAGASNTGSNTYAAKNILTADNQGSNAVFKLNGVDVVRSTNLVNDVVPGLTFTILDQTDSGETVTLSLATDPNALSSALQDMVSSYNAVVAQTDAQTGTAAGLLSGDFLVRQTQESLRELVNYNGTGSVKSLAALGIELDTSGKMSFNQDTCNALTDSQIAGGFDFLAGFGALAKNFTQISDPITGLIKTQQDQYDTTDTRLTGQITDLTTRIRNMQTTMMQQLQAADALLSQLESQQLMLDSSIQALNYTAYGKQLGS